MRSRWLLFLALGGCSGGGDDDGTEGEGEDECVRDTADDAADALPLAAGEEAEGFICPAADKDYYAVEVPGDNLLLRVQLVLEAPLSPVEASYVVYDPAGNPQRIGGTLPAGQLLDEVSCLEAGDYVVMVHDKDDVDTDFRHPYHLTVTTEPEPDTGEGDEASRSLALDGNAQTGRISCVGDVDRFNIDVPADTLLEVRLTSEIAAYDPSFRILDADGNLYFGDRNPGGSVSPTDIGGIYALPAAGPYVIEVLDDTSAEGDVSEADAAVPYSLSALARLEPDPNDRGTRNDFADAATTIGGKSCGGGWDSETISNGFLASVGDVDWYQVPLDPSCGLGIMEVDLDVGGATGIDPQIRVVRPYSSKSCARDEDCASLDVECEDDLGCSGVGNVCVGVVGDPDERDREEGEEFTPGACQGAAACLSGGICAATIFEKNAVGGTRVATSVPVYDRDEVYVVVQDFHSDGSDIDSPYTLAIRTRSDTDPGELDNVYNPYPHRFVDREANEEVARDAGGTDASGFCVSGTLATEADEDWFRYPGTCADSSGVCTIAITMNYDAGPVDFVSTIVRDGDDWFQTSVVDEAPNQNAMTLSYGPPDECFFSVVGDEEYYLLVFDNQGNTENPEVPDWSADQGYQICFAPYTPGCTAPCVWHDGANGDNVGCNVD